LLRQKELVENKRMASEIPTHMLNSLDNEVLNFKLKKLGALVISGLLVWNNNIPCINILTFFRFTFSLTGLVHKKVVHTI